MMSGRSERGAGTVIVLVIALVMAAAVGAGILTGQAIVAHHRVANTADLAALAGAQALQEGKPACSAADSTATANHAQLLVCRVDGQAVTVRVVALLRWRVPGLPAEAVAESRAGPR